MDRSRLCPAILKSLERLPPPHGHAYGVVPPPPPTGVLDLLPALPALQRAAGALARIQALAGTLPDTFLISRILPRQEAVSSSAVEGTHSTLDELLGTEEAEAPPPGPSMQVRDYALALQAWLPLAGSQGPALFTRPLIEELHRQVMAHDPDYRDLPGALREQVVWIGGGGDIGRSIFNPPPPARVAACLEDQLRYLRREDDPLGQHQALVTRMAVAHAHFEAIHPFRDGNGRVGRLLLPLMMAAEGQVPLYLSPYIETHRADYMQALQAAQQRLEWHVMVGFLAEAVAATADALVRTQARLQALGAEWRARRVFRAGSAARRALDLLPHYPVLTVKRLSAELGVSFPAAALAVRQLQEAGILRERTGYARNRLYAAQEVLAIYRERPED